MERELLFKIVTGHYCEIQTMRQYNIYTTGEIEGFDEGDDAPIICNHYPQLLAREIAKTELKWEATLKPVFISLMQMFRELFESLPVGEEGREIMAEMEQALKDLEAEGA